MRLVNGDNALVINSQVRTFVVVLATVIAARTLWLISTGIYRQETGRLELFAVLVFHADVRRG